MMKTLLLSTLISIFSLHVHGQSEAAAIGVANLTEHSLNDAKAYARSKSKDCIVVLYCGKDMANASEAIAGAQAASNQGVNVRGVVLATPDPEFQNGTESFTVYLHGICLDEKPKDATIRPEWMMREVLLHIANELSAQEEG